jgi:predicted amidophosphoribosyltransferase
MYQYIIRLGQTRQVGSRKTDRMKQLQDAYRVTHLNQIRGKHIIIVDDVLTTGATLESVAKILRGAGASRVDALVFARA